MEQIKYSGHLIICGWSHITQRLLDSLNQLTRSEVLRCVLIAEIDPALAEELVTHYVAINLKFVRGDWTHEPVLKRAGIDEAGTIVILPDQAQSSPEDKDRRTILATLSAKALNPKIKLMAQIMNQDNRLFLQRANADNILISDEFSGYLLASHTLATGLPVIVKEMLSFEGANRLTSVPIPAEYIGRSFADLSNYFQQKGAILIGLTREESLLEAADILSSDMSALDEFIRRKFEEAGRDTMDRARTNARLNPPLDTVINKDDQAIVIGRL